MIHGHIDPIPMDTNSKSRSKRRGFFHYCPSFVYVFVYFVIYKLVSPYLPSSVHIYGDWYLTWGWLLLAVVFTAFRFDLKKVSEAKTNNVAEVNWIRRAGNLYLVLFGISFALSALMWVFNFVLPAGAIATLDGIGWPLGTILDATVRIFNNMEFMLLAVFNYIWSDLSNEVNANTLQTQIGQTSPNP